MKSYESLFYERSFLLSPFQFCLHFTRLGLDHDGEGESSDCEADGSRGSVMAPLIVARYDRFHWSKCSREVIKENLEYVCFTLIDYLGTPKDY